MPKGSPIYNPDVQSDIDMKNTYKLINYPASSNILSVDKTIYVDAVNGTSGGARGTTAAFQTLAQAMAVVQAGDVIEVRSNIQYAGAITVSVAGVTLDFRNHVLSPLVQTDSHKLVISADGCFIKNLEINGLYTNGAGNGAAISITGKRCRLDNIYIHDVAYGAIDANGDFSDSSIRNIKLNNIRNSAIYFNSQNTTVTRADFVNISLTNVGDKGLAVARGGIEANQVYGVNIEGIYYDNIGFNASDEALYIHGITDFNISNVVGSGNPFNISCDACDHGTINNVCIRGGLTNQYCGLELAWCRKITVTNSIFDGQNRSGTFSASSPNAGIVASTANPETTPAGTYTISNVVSINWVFGIWMTHVYDLLISGSKLKGTIAAIATGGCGRVRVIGNDLESNGSDGFDTCINIDSGTGSNDTAYSSIGLNRNYLIANNLFTASSGCDSEIAMLSQDSTDTLSGIDIKSNRRLDSISLSAGTIKKTIVGGGSITNVQVNLNVPESGWVNDAITGLQGGTGVANSGKAITLGGNLTTSGANNVTLTTTGATNVTLPTSGTVESQANKGVASGYAPLDGSSKVPAANLPTLSAGTIASTTAVLKGDGSGNAVASTPTGTGDNVLATSPTLVTPTIGVATATSLNKWTLTAPSTAATLTAGADNLTYTMPDITSAIGFRNIPQNSQSAPYTTVLSDSGKEIFHPASDAATRTFTIDSNANVAYLIGTVILFTNMSAQVLTVAITADTMYLAGTGATGSRAITQYGSMVARKIGTTSWYAIPVAGVT